MINCNNLVIGDKNFDFSDISLSDGNIKYKNGDFLGKVGHDEWHSFINIPFFKIKSNNIQQTLVKNNQFVDVAFDSSTLIISESYFEYIPETNSVKIKYGGTYSLSYNTILSLSKGSKTQSNARVVYNSNNIIEESNSYYYHVSNKYGVGNLSTTVIVDLNKDDVLNLQISRYYGTGYLTTEKNSTSFTIIKTNLK